MRSNPFDWFFWVLILLIPAGIYLKYWVMPRWLGWA